MQHSNTHRVEKPPPHRARRHVAQFSGMQRRAVILGRRVRRGGVPRRVRSRVRLAARVHGHGRAVAVLAHVCEGMGKFERRFLRPSVLSLQTGDENASDRRPGTAWGGARAWFPLDSGGFVVAVVAQCTGATPHRGKNRQEIKGKHPPKSSHTSHDHRTPTIGKSPHKSQE
jgi:hypothetical protein